MVPVAPRGGPGPVTRPTAAPGPAPGPEHPLTRTFYLALVAGSLVDSSGHILIPGIYDQVAPLTEEERKLYKAIDLDLEEYRNSSRVERFLFDTKVWSQVDG